MLRWGGAVAAMMVACRGRTEVEKTWCCGGRNQLAYALIALPSLCLALPALSAPPPRALAHHYTTTRPLSPSAFSPLLP